MPAQRLPWVKLWIESLEHEKTAMLPDAEYRTWTACLLRGSQQSVKWRFASVQHAATVTGRPAKHIRALIGRELLDERDGEVWVHDAPHWQDRHPSDYGRGRSDDDPSNKEGTLREDSAKAPRSPRLDRDRDSDRDSSAHAEVVVPEKLRRMHAIFDGLPKYAPSEAFFSKVSEKYGHLDLEEEAIKAREWLAAQRSKACSVGFVLNWLGKAAERHAIAPITAPSRNGTAPEPQRWKPPDFERTGAPPGWRDRPKAEVPS